MTAPPLAVVDYGVAVHESAHVVTTACLGLRFSNVVLTPGPDAEFGGLVRGDPDELERRPLLYAVSLVAESRLTGQPLEVLAESCGSVDVALADELVRTIHPTGAHHLIGRGDRLVTANALAITTVAAALREHGRLDEDQVHAIVRATPAAAQPLQGEPHDHRHPDPRMEVPLGPVRTRPSSLCRSRRQTRRRRAPGARRRAGRRRRHRHRRRREARPRPARRRRRAPPAGGPHPGRRADRSPCPGTFIAPAKPSTPAQRAEQQARIRRTYVAGQQQARQRRLAAEARR